MWRWPSASTASSSSPRPRTPPRQQAALALAAAGPSIALAAAAETVAFALGTLTTMPALQNFSNFLLQVTALPALLALDFQRVEAGRYDLAPWVKAPAPWLDDDEEDEGGGGSQNARPQLPASCLPGCTQALAMLGSAAAAVFVICLIATGSPGLLAWYWLP